MRISLSAVFLTYVNSENWIRKADSDQVALFKLANTYIFIVIAVFELFDSNIGAS